MLSVSLVIAVLVGTASVAVPGRGGGDLSERVPGSAIQMPLVRWVESTYEEFCDGTLSDAMYVSHRAAADCDPGCVEFEARFDLNNDGYYDLVTPDVEGPYLRVYFGSANGYSGAVPRLLPITFGGGCDIADLNCDGHADLVTGSWHGTYSGRVFWGSDTGPCRSDTQSLKSYGAETVIASDLDRDGYLDLVFPGEDGPISICWGSADGFSNANRTEIRTGRGMAYNPMVADLNRDGYRDLAVVCFGQEPTQPIIYFGPNRTYRVEWLEYATSRRFGPHGLTVADLDNNGWLDVAYSGYEDIDEAYVYFGSPAGFSTASRTIVTPGKCYGGSAAHDFNKDGFLDLLFFRGNGNYSGAWVPIIYLNKGSAPYFSDGYTMPVGNRLLKSSGGKIADFNFDGEADIYVDNYDRYAQHPQPSLVLWGPDWTTWDSLPCAVDHHGIFREPGGVYDREYGDEYVSSVYDLGPDRTVHGGCCLWNADVPTGASVSIEFRSGPVPQPDPDWTDFYPMDVNGGELPRGVRGNRYLQYRAVFGFVNACRLPSLNRVATTIRTGGHRPEHDVAVLSIESPGDTVEFGATALPSAVVANLGSFGETLSVRMKIGDIYRWWAFVQLPAGGTETLYFAPWVPLLPGSKTVECWARLDGDQEPGNNLVRRTTFVRAPDVPSGTHTPPIGIEAVSPNPTRAGATVWFGVAGRSLAAVGIHDPCGREVRRLTATECRPGRHAVAWDGTDQTGRPCPAGVYFVRLTAGELTDQVKLILRR